MKLSDREYIHYPTIMDLTPTDLHSGGLHVWRCVPWYGLEPLLVVPGKFNADG